MSYIGMEEELELESLSPVFLTPLSTIKEAQSRSVTA